MVRKYNSGYKWSGNSDRYGAIDPAPRQFSTHQILLTAIVKSINLSKYRTYSECKWRAATKGAVNIGAIVGVSGGQPTKGAVNLGDQFKWLTAH